VETYRCNEKIPVQGLPSRYGFEKSFGTAIYYLLTPEIFSAFHRLPTDEIFHFYLGDPVTMLQLHPGGTHEIITLGTDLFAGQSPQVVVPRGTWQGSFLNEGGEFALLGATVSPGFDFSDYESGERGRLQEEYPSQKELIERLTVEP
jgi:predicted cupin superfamily sugar epimerase